MTKGFFMDVHGPIQSLFDWGTLGVETDAQLLDVFLDGDRAAAEAAFAAIVARHAARVRRVCLDVLGHAEEAEDASQAVFLILARRASGVRRRGSISSWLHGTARHVALRARRENDRRRHREQRWAAGKGTDEGPSDAVLSMISREDLHRELDRLPEIDRLPIVLCHLEGLSHAEAAARLGCPLRTFQSRLLRARRRLRDRLRRAGLETALVPPITIHAGWAEAVARSAMAFATNPGTPTVAATLAARILAARSAGRAAFAITSVLAVAIVAGAAARSDRPAPADPPGIAPAAAPIAPPRAEAPNRTMVIRVVDRDGRKPVEGARAEVTADTSDRYWFYDGNRLLAEKWTDAQGLGRIDFPTNLPRAFRIDVRKKGYALRSSVRWTHSSRADLPAEHTMELERGETLGGIVRNRRGEPIAGADVTVEASNQLDDAHDYSWITAIATTDANGRWQIDDAPPRLASITVHASQESYFGAMQHYGRNESAIDRFRDGSAEIILDKVFFVSGRVLDEAGRPLTGAVVGRAEREGKEEMQLPILTDSEGRFRVRLRTGPEILLARAPGHSQGVTEVDAASAKTPIEIRLGPKHRLSGRVVDTRGNPLRGVTVDAVLLWKGYRPHLWAGRTDSDGRFAWDFAPAAPITLGFSREGFAPLSRDGVLADKPAADIVMQRPLRVRGKVTDARTGGPIPRFTILDGHFRNDFPGEPDRRIPEWPQETPRREFTDGAYEIEYAHPYLAAVAVRIEADGYLPATSGRLSITAGEAVFDARLEPGIGPSGVVHGRDGRPLAGAAVVLWSRDDHRQSSTSRSTTDDRGAFHFPPQAGGFDLLVTHPSGFAEVRESDAEPGRPMTLTVEPWSRVEGTVTIGTKPAADETVTLFELVRQGRAEEVILRGLQGQSTRTDAHGRYVFERVLPGRVEVTRSRPLDRSRFGSARLAMRRETTEPGMTAHVDIGGGGRPVVGRFVIPPGVDPAAVFSVQGQQLVRVPSGSDDSPQPFLDVDTNVRPDGSFRVDDVPPGRYRLKAEVHNPSVGPSGQPGPKLAEADVQVIVPGASGGPPETPLDVGPIALKPVPPGSP
ncbi:sigma-70 family RNA polymerase sigma factor [Aquisphaera insulae]|uniref:sigma-70 family RNA polymerase sigma factor n=1 Tax=Aquisphaera insulae TaxID=2712864 RepID=UPI0013EDC3D0|nr:sigma-70 family RNA polymerase sigma factor [Aquisphaera insulae]